MIKRHEWSRPEAGTSRRGHRLTTQTKRSIIDRVPARDDYLARPSRTDIESSYSDYSDSSADYINQPGSSRSDYIILNTTQHHARRDRNIAYDRHDAQPSSRSYASVRPRPARGFSEPNNRPFVDTSRHRSIKGVRQKNRCACTHRRAPTTRETRAFEETWASHREVGREHRTHPAEQGSSRSAVQSRHAQHIQDHNAVPRAREDYRYHDRSSHIETHDDTASDIISIHTKVRSTPELRTSKLPRSSASSTSSLLLNSADEGDYTSHDDSSGYKDIFPVHLRDSASDVVYDHSDLGSSVGDEFVDGSDCVTDDDEAGNDARSDVCSIDDSNASEEEEGVRIGSGSDVIEDDDDDGIEGEYSDVEVCDED